MKKICSIIIAFIMLFTLSINAFAWDGVNWWNNLASEEIRNNSPQAATASHKRNMLLWNTEEQLYYKVENTGTNNNTSYYINSTTGIFYQTGAQKTFNVYKYENSVWNQVVADDGTKNFETYDILNYLLVSNTANVYIDDTSYKFNPESGELIVDGEVIEKPTEDEPTEEPTDDTSKSILEKISDFFSTFFEEFLSVLSDLFKPLLLILDFLFGILMKLGELLLEMLTFFGVFQELITFLVDKMTFLPDGYAKNLVALGIVGIIIALFNLVWRLFGGGKFGGD